MMDTTSDGRIFQLVLTEELRRPQFLASDEVMGGWRTLFPNLAACLPTPYPIYGQDEEQVVTYGYPVLRSEGIRKLQRNLDTLVNLEVDYRLDSSRDLHADKRVVMTERDRFHRSLLVILENVFMNDYSRGMAEVFLLFLTADIVRSVSRVPKMVRLAERDSGVHAGDDHRQAIAAVLATLIQRAAHGASDRLRKLAQVRLTPKISPVLGIICSEQILLTENQPSLEMDSLDGYLRTRFRYDGPTLIANLEHSIGRLSQLMARRSELGGLLALATGTSIDLTDPKSLLEPRLLKALSRADLLDPIGLSRSQARLCRDLGLSLKSVELLAALRRRILPMEQRSTQLVLSEPSSKGSIAPTTRPFDFTAPGVVDNSVRRFGLVYDLTNFTAVLEDVRKKGRLAEEKALQFMYVFQNRLEEIRRDHRLIFEKFLGDGAFYSSRRALRVLAAACDIQLLYDRLRRSGFPFDQGIRLAMNHGVYRLLPMLDSDREIRRFEFFGHGIVELARLTTGKSTRDIAEIAEFLIHAGYDGAEVDGFLAPISKVRSTEKPSRLRTYAASIDSRGELQNEGLVLTIDFVEHLETELEVSSFTEVTEHGARWLIFPIDPERPGPYQIGLRFLGVARLKGLAPLELAEAAVWTDIPAGGRIISKDSSLVDLLRRLSQGGMDLEDPDGLAGSTIDEDLVILTYLENDGTRQWVFGRHRAGDDVLLQAILVPMQIPALTDDEPIETWLFRNRYELERLYHGARRTDPGTTMPVTPLRRRQGYVGCFLAAPHKAP